MRDGFYQNALYSHIKFSENQRNQVSKIPISLFPALGTFFLLLCHLTQLWCKALCLGLLHFIVPCSGDVPGRPAL